MLQLALVTLEMCKPHSGAQHTLPVRSVVLPADIMITLGVEQMTETCRSVAKASPPLFRTDRVG